MDFHDIVNPLPVFVMSGFLGFPGTGFALTALDLGLLYFFPLIVL